MKFKKIVFYDLRHNQAEEGFLTRLGELSEGLQVVLADAEYMRQLPEEAMQEADALITRVVDHYPERLFSGSALKYIGTMHTDVFHFDVDMLRRKHITLTHVPSYAACAVAELTFGVLIDIYRRISQAQHFVRQGGWGFEEFMGRELHGKSLGVVGLGAIGYKVAQIGQAFGMQVFYVSRSRKAEFEEAGIRFMQLPELVKNCDVISLHCSLSAQTRGIMNSSFINAMSEGAVLLNASRGELVDIKACYERCRKGEIAVWFDELQDAEWRERFKTLANAYITPDFGWWTAEAQCRLTEVTIENARAFLEGRYENAVTRP